MAEAHLLRSALLHLLKPQVIPPQNTQPTSYLVSEKPLPAEEEALPQREHKNAGYKALHVVRRSATNATYGDALPPHLHQLIEDFYIFMTESSPLSQESPLRAATATVYKQHARLFLGWYSQYHPPPADLRDVFPDRERQAAAPVFAFIKWLGTHRGASLSYSASVLRGLTKLAKYRFSAETAVDGASASAKTFDDIPVIRELRKLHRDTNKGQKLSPRVSNEDRKWIDWPEFLSVIAALKRDLDADLAALHAASGTSSEGKRRLLALQYQKYLVLSMFSSVPDRQRTFRELALDSTFLRQGDCWVIKHGPEDYKTGRSYGDRPPLVLPSSLTPDIDDWIANYRPALTPTTKKLFVQRGTGAPLSGDSVYHIVTKTCFQYTGKKTNPHLLRDMVVTHVRDSSASEKELEALALYMGHSLQMQRTSYDRRTLKQKVAPAVSLLQSLQSRAKTTRSITADISKP